MPRQISLIRPRMRVDGMPHLIPSCQITHAGHFCAQAVIVQSTDEKHKAAQGRLAAVMAKRRSGPRLYGRAKEVVKEQQLQRSGHEVKLATAKHSVRELHALLSCERPQKPAFELSARLLHVKAPHARLHITQPPLNVPIDASSAEIGSVLHRLRGSRMMHSTHVLNLAGLEGFNDSCMHLLIALLSSHSSIFALNKPSARFRGSVSS